MTNELEKQFFQCFGIEPKSKCAKPLLKTTTGFCKAYKNCVGCDYNDLNYPQITDRILLELICLCPDLDDVLFNDVEELKETLLKVYISIYEHYATTEWLLDLADELKKRVRTLFEEG